jgi:error-prone DNA polymerase
MRRPSRCRPTSRPGSRLTTPRVPVRRADPRPGDVSQAADPRRRPAVRHRGARLDVNESGDVYRVERVGPRDEPPPKVLGADPRTAPGPVCPTPAAMASGSPGRRQGDLRREVTRIVAGQPYHSLTDFWHRARVSRPVVERLVLAGGFDGIYGIGAAVPVRRRGRVTRRDLLLQCSSWTGGGRSTGRSGRSGRSTGVHAAVGPAPRSRTALGAADDTWVLAAAQSQAALPVRDEPVQLALDLGGDPAEASRPGCPR